MRHFFYEHSRPIGLKNIYTLKPRRVVMNPLKIVITILMVMSTAGCSTYLYSAYVPAAAYILVNGPDDNIAGPEFSDLGILVASVDADKVQIVENIDNRQIFNDMRTATDAFRRLLKAKQVDNAGDYVLTRVDKTNNSEFALIAAVYRPQQLIDVTNDQFPGIRSVISDQSPAFYKPYQMDHDGSELDQVVAWSLVPVNCFNGSDQQGIILNETADALLDRASQTEFWAAREQWAKDGDAGILMLAGNLMSCPAPGSA
jgi:hypothetical protein